MAAFYVSQEDFNRFHTIDRELYTHLAIDLWRDPMESMQVMGFFLWLERMHHGQVVNKILSMPIALINELAEEAVICLNCINTDHFPASSDGTEISLLQGLLKKEMSLNILHASRLTTIQGVAKCVDDVCIRALADIMAKAVERNNAQSLLDTKIMLSSLLLPVVQPRLPQIGFGSADVSQPLMLRNDVPADERTVFVTFSKGYPVREKEVREFLTMSFGDCIESLHMQQVVPHEQSLFARVVLRPTTPIEVILGGVDKAKFSINGKHVWARKFVPKRPSSSQPLQIPTCNPYPSSAR